MSEFLFPLGWLTILVSILVLEFAALGRPEKGDTLSEQVWALMRNRWAAALLVALWSWLTWHFFIEPKFFKDWFLVSWTDDLLVIVSGVTLSLFLRSKTNEN